MDNSEDLGNKLTFTEFEVKHKSMFLILSKGVLWNVFSPVIDIAVNMALILNSRGNDINSTVLLYNLAGDYASYIIEHTNEIKQLKANNVGSGDFKNIEVLQTTKNDSECVTLSSIVDIWLKIYQMKIMRM